MKIRQLRKVINQGHRLGKYRIPRSHSKVYIAGLLGRLEWTCGRIKVIEIDDKKIWKIRKRSIR